MDRQNAFQTPDGSRSHLTLLELAHRRIAFLREHIKNFSQQAVTPHRRHTGFNALHFLGRLFQQYLEDACIFVEHNCIQWIHLNQKTILADNHPSIARLINDCYKRLSYETECSCWWKSNATIIIHRINVLLF